MGNAKGSAVLAAVKLLRSRRDAAAALVPQGLHRYLDERIVVGAWYPEEDLIGLFNACAPLVPAPHDQAFEVMGALAAGTHLEGVYSDLLFRGALSRARSLWRTQHDSGALSITKETPTSATYELVGWEHSSPQYCRVLGGYFAELHRLSGAVRPEFSHPTCRSLGASHCVWVVRWAAIAG